MKLTAILGGIVFSFALFAAHSPSAHAQVGNRTDSSNKIEQVKPGDTLTKIANRNETTYRRLFDANLEIKHPDVIYAGDKVRIPAPGEQLANRPLPGETPAAQAIAPRQQPVAAAPQPKPQPRRQSAIKPKPSANINGGVWDRLAQCESGGNWHINTGNGFYGGLQFTLSSWRAVGGRDYPHKASKAVQIENAKKLLAIQGWGAWPACSSKLGLR